MIFLNDLRYALRMLARGPGLTLTALLTIGVGIAATAVVFSVMDALLLRPLPVPAPSELVAVQEHMAPLDEGRAPWRRSSFAFPRYEALRDGADGIVHLAAWGDEHFSMRADGDAEVVFGTYGSANYFDVFGARPGAGRVFTEGIRRGGEDAAVVVLAEDYWRRAFGGEHDAIGRTVQLNGHPFTVIGVAPSGFRGNAPIARIDLWVPLEAMPLLDPYGETRLESNHWLQLFGRLAPGTELAQAEQALSVVSRGLDVEDAPGRALAATLQPLRAIPVEVRGGVFGFMALLQTAAAMVLLIASANVAGVLLARASARRREIAVRLAIGAGRGRLIRQLVTESLVLFTLGGIVGLTLAAWSVRLLGGWHPSTPIPLALELNVDARVIVVSLLAACVTGLIFGLAPALQASRPEIVPALKEGATGGGRRRTRLRAAFVVGQLAMLMLLLSTAGLFVRSVQGWLAADVDRGFEYDGVVVLDLDARLAGYDDERGAVLYEQLLERVRQLPGVRTASLSAGFPAVPRFYAMSVFLPTTGAGAEDGEGTGAAGMGGTSGTGAAAIHADSRLHIEYNVVDTDYFRTLRIPLLAGRDFETSDRAGAPGVAVVNQTLARQLWPGEDPIGRELFAGGNVPLRVIGLVPDGRTRDLMQDEPTPFLYRPVAQAYRSELALIAHAPGHEAQTITAIRDELRALDPNLPPHSARPLAATVGLSLMPQRIAASAIGGFGLVGLLLAALGLYGIIAFQVTQRTHEIGVRIALGARTGEVMRLVLRQGLGMIAAGLGIGLALAFGVTRLISGLMHGTGPLDLTTYLAASFLLIAVGLMASWLPARRAARVDPVVALKAG